MKRRKNNELLGPTEIGQIGRHGDNYYLVTCMGTGGGCSGPCVFGPREPRGRLKGGGRVPYMQLRSKTVHVPDDEVPDAVRVAIAAYALIGKVPA